MSDKLQFVAGLGGAEFAGRRQTEGSSE